MLGRQCNGFRGLGPALCEEHRPTPDDLGSYDNTRGHLIVPGNPIFTFLHRNSMPPSGRIIYHMVWFTLPGFQLTVPFVQQLRQSFRSSRTRSNCIETLHHAEIGLGGVHPNIRLEVGASRCCQEKQRRLVKKGISRDNRGVNVSIAR